MSGPVVARIRGIDVRINWAVVLMGLAVAWSLANGVLVSGDGATLASWVAASVVTIGFFLGLLGHEFGHAVVAQREGVRVSTVTLWMFGGVAALESPVESPRAAFRIAIAGPIVSVGYGLAALAVSLPLDGLARSAASWLGLVNLGLAAFNMIPAFPLDGGRVYQSLVWRRTNSELTATVTAARLGRLLASGLIGAGITALLVFGAVAGAWLVALGWFVVAAGRAEVDYIRRGRPLADVDVAKVMSPRPVVYPAGMRVSEFVGDVLAADRHASYPVVDTECRLVGLVMVADLQPRVRSSWETTLLQSVARPRDTLIVVNEASSVLELLQAFDARRQHRAVVVDDDERPVGVVSPSDITRFVALSEVAALTQPA